MERPETSERVGHSLEGPERVRTQRIVRRLDLNLNRRRVIAVAGRIMELIADVAHDAPSPRTARRSIGISGSNFAAFESPCNWSCGLFWSLGSFANSFGELPAGRSD